MNVVRKNSGYMRFDAIPVGNPFEVNGEVFMKTELILADYVEQVNANAISFLGKWKCFENEDIVKLLDAEVVVKN